MLRASWLLFFSIFIGCSENYISAKREGLKPYQDQEHRSREAQESRDAGPSSD